CRVSELPILLYSHLCLLHITVPFISLIHLHRVSSSSFLFFFNDTATTEIYTLSLHDALPILRALRGHRRDRLGDRRGRLLSSGRDRKSTRLNSSHEWISYAVFCLKKKKKKKN